MHTHVRLKSRRVVLKYVNEGFKWIYYWAVWVFSWIAEEVREKRVLRRLLRESHSVPVSVTPRPIFFLSGAQLRISYFASRSFQLTRLSSFVQPLFSVAITPKCSTMLKLTSELESAIRIITSSFNLNKCSDNILYANRRSVNG